MGRIKLFKKTVIAGMLMAGMGMLGACGLRSVPSHMDKVGNGEIATVSTSAEITSEASESEESSKTETSTETITEDVAAITEDDLRRLIAGNIKCNAWFGYSSLPTDPSADLSQSGRQIDTNYFADYASFEEYIRSVYCKQEADRLLYNFPEEGVQKYYDQDGMLYLNTNYDGAKGYYVDWSGFTLTIDSTEGNQCTFTVTATVEEPADVPQKEPYSVTQTAIFEDGRWVLTELFE